MTQDNQDYRPIFEQRGHHYNSANKLCPTARITERQLMLDRLNLAPGITLCDMAAGGGYLADGATQCIRHADVLCLEPSFEFARGLDPRFVRIVADMHALPLPDRHVDRVSSLAALHHIADKRAVVREALRILKPGGRMVLADVATGTAPATFLNGPCDRYSLTGHQGMFWNLDEALDLMHGSGLEQVEAAVLDFTWNFPDEGLMIEFCRRLFGLYHAEPPQVHEALKSHLRIDRHTDHIRMHWSLLYAQGVRPGLD